MTGFVIRYAGLAGLHTVGDLPDEGGYLTGYDVDAHDGRGSASFDPEPGRALVFPTPAAAFAAWRTPSTVRPTRGDGRPNRPLTAFSVAVEADPLGRND